MSTVFVTVSIGAAAELLGIPGPTRSARAQKLRRLERAGIVPAPERNGSGDRVYSWEHLHEVEAALRSGPAVAKPRDPDQGCTIKDVAAACGVTPQAIQQAEKAGRIPAAPRREDGSRVYTPELIRVVHAVLAT